MWAEITDIPFLKQIAAGVFSVSADKEPKITGWWETIRSYFPSIASFKTSAVISSVTKAFEITQLPQFTKIPLLSHSSCKENGAKLSI